MRVWRFGLVENLLECFQYRDAVGKHSVRQQKRVKEINTEESEVGQSLQQTFRRRGPDLRHFAGVQGTTEPDVHVVLEQFRIVADGLRHCNGTGVRQ